MHTIRLRADGTLSSDAPFAGLLRMKLEIDEDATLRSFFRLHQHEMPPMDIVVTPKRHLRADKFDLSLAENELLPLLAELSEAPGAENAAPTPSGDAA